MENNDSNNFDSKEVMQKVKPIYVLCFFTMLFVACVSLGTIMALINTAFVSYVGQEMIQNADKDYKELNGHIIKSKDADAFARASYQHDLDVLQEAATICKEKPAVCTK